MVIWEMYEGINSGSDEDADEEESEDNNSKECSMAIKDEDDEEALVRGSSTWLLDSGCSRHMTEDRSLFLSLNAYNGGSVTFGNNEKDKIAGSCKVER